MRELTTRHYSTGEVFIKSNAKLHPTPVEPQVWHQVRCYTEVHLQAQKAVNQCRLKVYLAPNSPSDTSSEAESESDTEPKTKTKPPPKKRKLSQYWIADLDLKTSDKAIIERGRELTDRHMEAAHKVLAEQFPHLQGLQSTLLAQTGSVTPVSECSGFIPEG